MNGPGSDPTPCPLCRKPIVLVPVLAGDDATGKIVRLEAKPTVVYVPSSGVEGPYGVIARPAYLPHVCVR